MCRFEDGFQRSAWIERPRKIGQIGVREGMTSAAENEVEIAGERPAFLLHFFWKAAEHKVEGLPRIVLLKVFVVGWGAS